MRSSLLPVLLLAVSCASTSDSTAESTEDAPASPELEAAISMVDAGDLAGGIDLLEDVLARSDAPEAVRTEARRWLGHALTREGDPEAALEHYRRAIEHAPEDAWLHYAAGTALFTMGRNDEAIGEYTRAVECDATHVKALQWRGHACSLLERHEEAVLDYRRAIDLLEAARAEQLAEWGGDRTQMLYWTHVERGRSLDALGRYEEAEQERERANALYP